MKCHTLFSKKNKKSITNLLSVESAHGVVSVKTDWKSLQTDSQCDLGHVYHDR